MIFHRFLYVYQKVFAGFQVSGRGDSAKMGLVGGFSSFNPLKNDGVSWDDASSQFFWGKYGGFFRILKNMKVHGKDDIPYMKWKVIKAMFQTTNQSMSSLYQSDTAARCWWGASLETPKNRFNHRFWCLHIHGVDFPQGFIVFHSHVCFLVASAIPVVVLYIPKENLFCSCLLLLFMADLFETFIYVAQKK